MYIFIDESGDCGFNVEKQGTSRHFVITALVCDNQCTQRLAQLAVKRTLSNKLNRRGRKNLVTELKGATAPDYIKKYFYSHISKVNGWGLYSLIIDKLNFKIPHYINKNSAHLYNFFTGYLIDMLHKDISCDVVMTVDKCKTNKEIDIFNEHIESIFYSHTKGKYSLTINHVFSHNDKTLQVVDVFCNGVFKKYEDKSSDWYTCFKDRIILEENL